MKTISSHYVIQRTFSNNGINNANWTADAKDWIAQAVGFIGKHGGLDVRVCVNLKVENHHVDYPFDFEGLIAVTYKGFMLPLGADLSESDLIRRNLDLKHNTLSDEDLLALNLSKQRLQQLISDYASNPLTETHDAIVELTNDIEVLEESMTTMNLYISNRSHSAKGEFFNTKSDRIQTSFETGYINLIYVAFPVDDDGYLKVVDNEWYLDALEWYILMILIKKGYQHPLFDWKTVRAEWFTARGRAANQLKIPSLAAQERFARMWTQCIFRRSLPNQLFNRAEQTFGTIY